MSERRGVWLGAMPVVFVLVWATGFVVARYGMPHAPPLGFLTLRYALSVLAFALWIAPETVAIPETITMNSSPEEPCRLK